MIYFHMILHLKMLLLFYKEFHLVKILEKNNCDIPTYEAIDHIISEEMWNQQVVISRKTVNNEIVHLKILEIKGDEKFRLKTEKINLTIGEK